MAFVLGIGIDRNSVVSQASCRMVVTRVEKNFTHGEAGGIRRFQHRWQRTVDALGD